MRLNPRRLRPLPDCPFAPAEVSLLGGMRRSCIPANLISVRTNCSLSNGLRILNLFAALWSTAAFLHAIQPNASGAAELTFLRAEGKNVVNGNGDKVLLRGVGLGNWLLPEGYMWKFGNQAD